MEYLIRNILNYSDDKINEFYKKLSPLKKEKFNKYTVRKKKSSIIGEMMLSELLLRHNLVYESLDFTINEYGKPHFKDIQLYFNISHSYDYVAVILGERLTGIDIEKVRKTNFNTTKFFATPNEKIYIQNIEERLFQIYTLKEAYFKMKGTSLDKTLDVEFKINENTVTCSDDECEVGFITSVNGYIVAYAIRKE